MTDILDGSVTSTATLKDGKEILNFWKVLSGCVVNAEMGPQIDLIGCRVVEDPKKGAELLRMLSDLISVPFTASDDAIGGCLLYTSDAADE